MLQHTHSPVMLHEGKPFTILHGQPEIVLSTLLLLNTYIYIGSGFKPKSDPLSVGGVARDCGGFRC